MVDTTVPAVAPGAYAACAAHAADTVVSAVCGEHVSGCVVLVDVAVVVELARPGSR